MKTWSIWLSATLYILSGIILITGIPAIIQFHLYFDTALIIFLALIHFYTAWNVVKEKHITLILAPCFELYFLFNLYLLIHPFSRDTITVSDSTKYSTLLLISGSVTIVVIALRLFPVMWYRKLFIH